MQHSTKLLAIVVLSAALAAPAFAQSPNCRDEPSRGEWSSRVHVYAPDFYARSHGNNSTNPDYQLGGDR